MYSGLKVEKTHKTTHYVNLGNLRLLWVLQDYSRRIGAAALGFCCKKAIFFCDFVPVFAILAILCYISMLFSRYVRLCTIF